MQHTFFIAYFFRKRLICRLKNLKQDCNVKNP